MNYFYLVAILFFLGIITSAKIVYNPLTTTQLNITGKTVEFIIHDKQRKRNIPIRIYLQ